MEYLTSFRFKLCATTYLYIFPMGGNSNYFGEPNFTIVLLFNVFLPPLLLTTFYDIGFHFINITFKFKNKVPKNVRSEIKRK